MLGRLILFVAPALICCAIAFPLSALFAAGPFNDARLTATQLLPLHDGTYLALMHSYYSVTDLELNSRVRIVPLPGEVLVTEASVTTIVARLRPANDSIIWAYAASDFKTPAFAVVDDAGSIFVVGDAGYISDTDFINGFRVLRFSVNGELIWRELYTDKALGLPNIYTVFFGEGFRSPYVGLADPRTLAIVGVVWADRTGLGRKAIFVDTFTRKARLVRFPLPDGSRELVQSSSVTADSASGAACFADITLRYSTGGQITGAPIFVEQSRLFVQCAKAAGGSEVASRVLVPFEENIGWDGPHVVMGGGGKDKAAVLYVVAIRHPRSEVRTSAFPYTRTDSNKATAVTEMLLYKLDPTTLQNVEWESGLISTKPTMRKVLLSNSSSLYWGSVTRLRYIRDQGTLVVLYESFSIFDRIRTLSDGTIAFRGNSSIEAVRTWGRQWLLYFGNDPEPKAVRIPDDPRPDGEQDEFNLVVVEDFELSEDGRGLYLFGRLQNIRGNQFGHVITVPFPMPEFTQPCGGSPEMGDGLGNVLKDDVDESFEPSPDESFEPVPDESFEPSPDETAEASTDETLEPSSNPLLQQDI